MTRVEAFNERERLREIHRAIVARIEDAQDLAEQLARHSPNLLDLIRADGSAAALHLNGHWVTVGQVPSEAHLDATVDWLLAHHAGEAVYAEDALPGAFPGAREFSAIGAGLLAISVPKTARNYILLFRPEILSTVRWAGDPGKKNRGADGRLHPRGSFTEWRETIRGRAQPWRSWEIDTALELRSAILALDRRRQFAREQAARRDAERAKS